MTYYLIVAVLLAAAVYLILDFRFLKSARYTQKQVVRKGKQMLKRKPKLTAKEYVRIIDGKKKENVFSKALGSARYALDKTGRGNKYKQTVRFAVGMAGVGMAIGLIFKNFFLSVVLGIGLYFIPLWIVTLSIYSYDKLLGNELETALSMITTAYNRHNSIIKAVEESLPNLNNPVKECFSTFLSTVKYVDANTVIALEELKEQIDNPLFHQWVDNMILCQSDHTQKASLMPIVNEFSERKAQQQENETNMMIPLRDTLTMAGIVIGSVPLLYLLNKEWYSYLVDTFQGRLAMAIAAAIVLLSINKAVKLTRPVD